MSKEKRMEKRFRMYKPIEQYFTLNQTQKQFCEEHDIKLPAFQYWLKKHRKEQKPKSTATSEQAFIPVKRNIKLPNMWNLKFPS